MTAAAVVLTAAIPAGAAGLGPVAPMRYDVEPGSDVLISEVANGGAGATSQANRDSTKNFIEITNYGQNPMDISGWKIFRCGQTGGGYGPQAVIAEGTVLQPGDQYTTARDTSGYDVDSYYGTSLHTFGFGAFLEDASGQRVDAIGFYHEDIATDCEVDGNWLQGGLQHRLDESHQRVSTTGDLEQDWIIAPRTVDAPNATERQVARIDNGLRFSELNSGAAGHSWDQYVEVTNYGDAPVDMSGYQLFRCGENGTQYLQVGSLPDGSVVEPGDSYLAARTGGAYADQADITYGTAMHWRDFGVMLLTPQDEIVDRVGVFDNRNSPCSDGNAIDEKLNHFDSTTYQRVADTGDNLTDFIVTGTRTPGIDDPTADYAPAPTFGGLGDVRISEIAAGGPAGGDDEFFELANYGTQPVDMNGWSAYRCYGTGQPGVGPDVQIADLGATLQPGETYLGVPQSAPAALRDIADGTYGTGLNRTDGYGLYITDADGALVDAFAAYDVNVNQYTPCRLGQEARNRTKDDLGESYTRAQSVGDNELDFVVTAERTPGELVHAEYVDPTQALPGELDPVAVDTNRIPGTPSVTIGDDGSVSVTTTDEDGEALELTARSAELRNSADVVVRQGVSPVPVPSTLEIDGEQLVEETGEVTGTAQGYPFQRFEVPTDGPVELVWSGTAEARNELQMLLWVDGAWQQADAAVPSSDGDITLVGQVGQAAIADGVAQLLVIDGPRTSGGLIDEIDVQDNAFANPGSYDVAINHMTDTQFLSEGFRDVFRQMASWVVANADARNIGYTTNTGDIIENWMNGNHSDERANREFQAAQDIMSLINDADIPNGVLPGNHDNMWGYNNDKYNEYFPVSMYQDKPWYGEAWAPGDNSAHTDYFSAGGVDFLVISLQYRPSKEQMAWASAQAAAHPDHSVVLAAHSYLHTSGERDDIHRRYSATGQDVWETVVAPNDNVFLVLGGHYHGVSTMYGDPVTGEQVDATEVSPDVVAVSNVGESGRTVVEMLADYQGYRSTLEDDPTVTRADMLDRDTGFQRLLQLDLDAGLMAVNAYSPAMDTFEAWNYDEPAYRGANARYDTTDEEFVVAVDLVRSTTLSPTTWTVTGASSEFANTLAQPGEAVTLEVPAEESDQLWYAQVVDSDGNTVRSVPTIVAVEAPIDPEVPTEEPTDAEQPTDEPTGPGQPTEEPTEPSAGGTPGDDDDAAGDDDAPGVEGQPGAGGPGSGAMPSTGVTVTSALVLMALLLGAGALLLRRRAVASS